MRCLSIALFALAALPSPAWACGGMFCDSVAPVDQAAERIIFSFDGEMLDIEVQISFQGQDDDFAWVVPVPAPPELYLSNDALFTAMANATQPQFTLVDDTVYVRPGVGCAEDEEYTLETGFTATNDSASDTADSGDTSGVHVLSNETVGPYDTVVLQAENADVLVTWLQGSGYSLPSTLGVALDPYVATDQYFVALKLSSSKNSGDLAPLRMRYPATAASIPIQLTAIAAIPDLPIEVFLLGASRAVPDNYLHVRLNDAAFNWYSGSTNYRDVVARAVDEAGGQAYATDYVGDPATLSLLLWSASTVNEEYAATLSDAIAWLDYMLFRVPASSQLSAALVGQVPPPDGVSEAEFLACPGCYADELDYPDFDPVAATAALDVSVFQVLAGQAARVKAASTLTRLFTTMDPEEMTADPIFVFNADLEQSVPLLRSAIDHTRHIDGEDTERSLELEDGRVYPVDAESPSTADIDSPAALLIEDLGASGAGTLIFDGTAAAGGVPTEPTEGCANGCGSATATLAPLLLIGAGLLRRRRG